MLYILLLSACIGHFFFLINELLIHGLNFYMQKYSPSKITHYTVQSEVNNIIIVHCVSYTLYCFYFILPAASSG